MKKAYKYLIKKLPIVMIGALISTLFGVLAFRFSYNVETSWLNIKSFCTIGFAVVLLAVIGYAIYTTCMVKHFHIAKIRKKFGFLRTCSLLACFVLTFFFVFDFVRLIVSSYSGLNSFDGWRVVRFILSLPFAAYFLIMALPTRYKRKKLNVPKKLIYICSVCSVLWCVFSILTVYFYKGLTTTNILKLWQIVVYLAYAVFFLFEIKFELIGPCPKRYMSMGLVSFILSMAFTFSTIIARIFEFIPQSKSLSVVELLCSFVIGIYALARVYAIPQTMKHVINTTERDIFSSKFDTNQEKSSNAEQNQ